MTLTPEDIETHTFKVSRRGYDKVEVDRFLGQIATSFREVQSGAATVPGPAPLPQRVPAATGAAPGDAQGTVAGELFEVEADRDDFNRLGSEVADVLRTAHHSVATLRHEAEVEAAVIRQQAEREVADLRREADEYATRIKSEADTYAGDRAAQANFSRREAERVLAEAQAKADANLADTERRVAAITGRAEAMAQARTEEILADANRRITDAHSTEQALRQQLIAAHGDLTSAIGRFPATPEPVVDLSDEAMAGGTPVVDLTEGRANPANPASTSDGAEPIVPTGWPGGVGAGVAHGGDLFADDRTGGTTVTAERQRPTAPPTDPLADAASTTSGDPLADAMKSAIGRAVQSAMTRTDDPEG